MRTHIIRIGNSQGVRIPKALLEEAKLHVDVEMSVKDGALVIVPAHVPRHGWAQAFRDMALQGDDALLDADAATTEAFAAEWEWE
jgi:antitoxin MazE